MVSWRRCGRSSCPPAGSAEGAALRRELHSCFADQPRFELKIRTPCHHGHARPIGQPNKRPDAGGSLCDVCACVAHYGPQECGQFHPRRMSSSKCREKSARQMFYVHEVRNLLRASNFRTPARPAGFENFRLWSIGGSGGLLRHVRSTPGSRHQAEGVGIRWVPRDMNLSGDTGVEDPRATAESQRRRPSPMLN
jgi:hypothetical protein